MQLESEHPAAGISIRRARRGSLSLQLAGANRVEREMVARLFQSPEVKSVSVLPGGLMKVSTRFRSDPRTVVRSLAQSFRNPAPTAPIAAVLPQLGSYTLHRTGGVLTSWTFKRNGSDCIVCGHPMLKESVALRFSVEEVLAVLRGIRSATLHRRRGEIRIRFAPGQLRMGVVVAALESALESRRPTAEFLPPTRAGYALDAAQILSASMALGLPVVGIPLSAVLLAVCYAPQLRDAWKAALGKRVDWNTVIAAVVALTIWNGSYLAAALMSLALRSWKSLEHRTVIRELEALRIKGLTPRQVRQVASATFAHDDSGVRAVKLASSAAPATLTASAAAMVLFGAEAALASVRPDYVTSTRLGDRLAALRTLSACAARGVFPSRWSSVLAVARVRKGIACPGEAEDRLGSFGPVEFVDHGLDANPHALCKRLAEAVQNADAPILYIGGHLPWSQTLREKILWCVPADIEIRSADTLPDITFACSTESGLRTLLVEAKLSEFPRSFSEKWPLVGNGMLSLAGALTLLPPWAVAIATNALTASVWTTVQSSGIPRQFIPR